MSSYSIEMNDTNLDLVPNNRRTSDTELGISSTGSGPESGAEHRLGSRTRHPMAHGAATRPTAAPSELGTHPVWLLDRVSDFKDPIWIWIMSPHFWPDDVGVFNFSPELDHLDGSKFYPNWIIWIDPNFTLIGSFGWIQILPSFTPEDVSNLSHDMDQVDQAEGLQSGAIHGSYGQGPWLYVPFHSMRMSVL